MSKVIKIHDIGRDEWKGIGTPGYMDPFLVKKHWEIIDLSEFTDEEIKVIERFIYKFPDYMAITEIVIGEENDY